MKREEAENRTNRLFVRISIVQTIIAGATVLISLAALWTAFVQAESTRLQTEASVWPFVDVGYTILPDDEGAQGALFIENTGVGPARIRAVRVLYQGEPMTHWRMYFASTGYERTPYTFIQMTHQVLAPNQSLNALLVRDETIAAALRRQAMP